MADTASGGEGNLATMIPYLYQIYPSSRTPELLELMGLNEVYSAIINALPTRPLRTSSPGASLDWLKNPAALRLPPYELRSEVQDSIIRAGMAADHLLGLYYLLLLPIGNPIGLDNSSTSTSPIIQGFRQSIGLSSSQTTATPALFRRLDYLADRMAKKAVMDMDHLYPRRYVPPGEKQALNLTDLYAWLILGSQGTVSFAAWTTFLQDLRESIPALPLQAPVKALAETCLEGIIHEAINKEEEVTRALARLQLGSLPTPAEDRAERLIQEAANASLQGIMAESWAVVPTPQDVVGEPEDDGEEDLAPGEADVALSSPQNSGGHFVIPAPVRSDDGDDEEDSPQVSEDSFVDTVDMLDEEEIRIELPSRRRSLLLSPTTSRTYSTSKTFGDYPATPRSSRWSHHSLASPPESPESEPELEVSSSTEAATSNIRFHPLVNDRATSHVVPAHRLEVKEERPGVIGWLKRIGKGIASVMEG